ncbi:DUF692 domain-containing protein [Chelatococcus sambhunathii]|uniref:UPF0276 protein IHQ68_10475 n=1 Tax=Chelatococcus sambhunathii TaxID=363953 RepID=A0ABU1DFZ3_9HYPH|nr:DUF692 domain-containing protein [Chelatococcus sambhunathii]MDR4307043.1 DUF692 domain-containing protein [Chelatococcus sambhunathii]
MRDTTLPATAGVGFKPDHFAAILETGFDGFLEVHAENYMGAGGPPHAMLGRLREDHALSIHGVGLSIGGAGPLSRDHLARLRTLCERYEPESFSEHLAWSTHDGVFLNDLLPLPYTGETLARVVDHVDETQAALGRRMLLENPATYVTFAESEIPETEFLSEIARLTGCGLLLDVNNVFVSATNHGFSAEAYLAEFPLEFVGEIHLGGHDAQTDDAGAALLIDAHGAPVAHPVWTLYERVLARTGPIASLIEWDNDVPEWPTLAAEAERADVLIAAARRRAA